MSSSSTNDLATFEARVQWAIENRRVYVFPDNEKVRVLVKEFNEDDDDEDIQHAQKSFEKKYKEKKRKLEEEEEEQRKLEENKRKEEEEKAAKQLEELLIKFPGLREGSSRPSAKPKMKPVVVVSRPMPRPVAGPSKRAGVSFDDDHDDDEPEPPAPKRAKTVKLKGTPGGPLYPVSCRACELSGHECREQIPVKTICYRCASGRIKCSLKPGPKYGRGANRGRVVSRAEETDFEVESEDEPMSKGREIPRRSARHENEITRDDIKTLIESLNELTRACHTGFKDLVGAMTMKANNQAYLNEKVDGMHVDFRKVTDRMRREDGEFELGWRGTGSKSKKIETSSLLLGEMKRRKVDQLEITKESTEKAVKRMS